MVDEKKTDEKKPDTKPYRLREGRKFIVDGAQVPAGTVVDLNPVQAKAFRDSFESLSDADVKAREEAKEKAKKNEAVMGVPSPTSHLPQDMGAKTMGRNQEPVNEGNLIGEKRAGSGISEVQRNQEMIEAGLDQVQSPTPANTNQPSPKEVKK